MANTTLEHYIQCELATSHICQICNRGKVQMRRCLPATFHHDHPKLWPKFHTTDLNQSVVLGPLFRHTGKWFGDVCVIQSHICNRLFKMNIGKEMPHVVFVMLVSLSESGMVNRPTPSPKFWLFESSSKLVAKKQICHCRHLVRVRCQWMRIDVYVRCIGLQNLYWSYLIAWHQRFMVRRPVCELSPAFHWSKRKGKSVSLDIPLTYPFCKPILLPSLRSFISESFLLHSFGLPKVFSISPFNSGLSASMI